MNGSIRRDPARSWCRPGLAKLGRGLSLLGCLWLTGCYALVPANPNTITAPARVEAHLSPEGAERVAEVFGGPQATVSGLLVAADAERLSLEVPVARVPEGMRTEALKQTLIIPRAEIAALQRRELDRLRTGAVLVVGAAVVGLVLARTFGGDHGGTTVLPPGGGGPESRSPTLGGAPR